MEEWKPVPGHPEFLVSNLGNLANWAGVPRRSKLIQKGKRVKAKYLGFNVVLNECLPSGRRRTKTLKLHQVVALLFIGPCPPGMIVMHKDDDRHNNRADNLVYGTWSDNVKLAIRNKKMIITRGPGGQFTGSAHT